MSHVGKPDLNAIADRDPLAVFTGYEHLDRIQGILHYIDRFILRTAGTFPFSVSPLRLELLDMRTVAEHDIAEIAVANVAKI